MEKITKMTANEVINYLRALKRIKVYIQSEDDYYTIEDEEHELGEYVLYEDIELLVNKMTGEENGEK